MEKNRTKSADLMRKDVVTLAPDDTIERALELFEEHRIGGAPVVDSLDNLVGVLTLSDITRAERLSDGRIGLRRRSYEMSEPVGDELVDELDPGEIFFVKEDYSAELLKPDLVGDWMLQAVISVTPDTALEDACQVMLEEHIHRVFVADQGKLRGVISSFDVVRHIARAAPARRTSPRKVVVPPKAAAAPKAKAAPQAAAVPRATAAPKAAAARHTKAARHSTTPGRGR